MLSDAAMHAACLRTARRWCPHLHNPASHIELIEVAQVHICGDSTRLDLIVDYGDEISPQQRVGRAPARLHGCCTDHLDPLRDFMDLLDELGDAAVRQAVVPDQRNQ